LKFFKSCSFSISKIENLPVDHQTDYKISLLVFILVENADQCEDVLFGRHLAEIGNPIWTPGGSF
jgi:hypothetical protein